MTQYDPGVGLATPPTSGRATTRRSASSSPPCASARRSTRQAAGLEPGGLDDLPALPFTTKEEIRASLAAEPPLGRHAGAPAEAVRRVFSTSGTTGDPLYIAVTDDDLAGWTEIGARSYAACGIAPGQRAVLTYNSGPFVAGAVLDAWSRIGATVIPVGSGNTERLVKAFQVLGAEALGCTPSYALYLADWCRARDIDPAGLGVRRLAVAGEPGGGEPATRQAIERRSAPPSARRWGSPTSRPRCGASARSRPACTSAAATSSTPS